MQYPDIDRGKMSASLWSIGGHGTLEAQERHVSDKIVLGLGRSYQWYDDDVEVEARRCKNL